MPDPAPEAKNHFGGLLELVLVHKRVEITKHGRVVAVIVAPGADAPAGHADDPGTKRASRAARSTARGLR